MKHIHRLFEKFPDASLSITYTANAGPVYDSNSQPILGSDSYTRMWINFHTKGKGKEGNAEYADMAMFPVLTDAADEEEEAHLKSLVDLALDDHKDQT